MRRLGFQYNLVTVATFALLSGCGGGGSQINPPGGGTASGAVKSAGRYSGIVFVSDLDSNAVWVCPAKFGDIRNGFLCTGGTLSGVSEPVQLAIDAQGTIYVANSQTGASGAGSVTEYPRGAKSPAKTLTTGLNTSTGVAVDSAGTVYASNKYFGSIVVFAKGASAPTETITANLIGPDGLAVDKADNLYIADSSAGDVLELARGSKTPRSLHLKNLTRPIGAAVDSKGNLFVSNQLGQSSNVLVYARGSSVPAQTIVVPGPPYGSESTIAEPMMLSIAKPLDELIASAPLSLALVGGEEWFGYAPAVVGFASGQTTPTWSVYSVAGSDAVFQPGK